MTSQPSIDRIMVALFLGALCGGGLTGLFLSARLVAGNGHTAIPESLAIWAFISIPAFFAWLTGIIIFGGLPWLFLHKMRFRHWACYCGSGAFLPTLLLLAANIRYSIPEYVAFAVIGGGVGWVIWRIAYFKMKAPKP